MQEYKFQEVNDLHKIERIHANPNSKYNDLRGNIFLFEKYQRSNGNFLELKCQTDFSNNLDDQSLPICGPVRARNEALFCAKVS